MLLAALESVCTGKNCDPGLENAALGLWLRAAFSRPRSQFFPIRTSQSANTTETGRLFFRKRTKQSLLSRNVFELSSRDHIPSRC